MRAAEPGTAKAVRAATDGRGVDAAFEAAGHGVVIETAYRITRKGGTVSVVGAARTDDLVALSPFDLMMSGKSVVGCQYGSTVPARDFPMLLDHWREGRMPLDRLVTRRISLHEVNSAFGDLTTGTGLRTVIVND